MSRPKRPPRARTLARRQRVVSEKLVLAKHRLLDLEAGGTPARPLEVATSAIVEPKAKSVLCPACDQPFDVASHEARTDEHGRLREVRLRCRLCGTERSLWFRISAAN